MALNSGRVSAAVLVGLLGIGSLTVPARAQGIPSRPEAAASEPLDSAALRRIEEEVAAEASDFADEPAAERRNILLEAALSLYAEEAGIPGDDTNMLTPAQRAGAAAIVDRVLAHASPSPSPRPPVPPQPRPAPVVRPVHRPAPMPYYVVVWPQQPVVPVVVQPVYYVYQPTYFVPVVVPARKHHFFR